LKADRGDDPRLEIVGVASDAVYRSLRDPAPPTMYVPADQALVGSMPLYASISVRSIIGNATALIPSLRATLTPLDLNVTMTLDVMATYVQPWLIRDRVLAELSGLFALVALLLAAMGIFGLTSYSVERRRGELGVRLALGATPSRVRRMVLTRAVALTLAGTGVGLVPTLWVSRLLGPILYRVDAGDTTAFATGFVALTLAGVIAAWLPARRAARLDPSAVLREL
jgi:ABC-type antimicrobial peptide transport system permease subunit